MKKIKIFSFFSGSGFLDLGFEKNGFDICLINEYSKSFMRAYTYSRKHMGIAVPEYGMFNTDINDFFGADKYKLKDYIKDARNNGYAIGFIGGPPCPDFSIAGKNRGKEGDNGKLSLSYVKLIIDMQPDFFLFENVKGLWKTVRHRQFFNELKDLLRLAGYDMTEKLVNAIEYGAPQDRERILLFGMRKRTYDGIDMSLFNWDKHKIIDIKDVKNAPWPVTAPFQENSVTECPANLPSELTVEHWFRINDVNSHPNSQDFFIPRGGLIRMQTIEEGDVSKKSYKRLHRWRYSPTVAYGNNEVHLHPYHARRLSAAEALALQSLPKEFELPQDMTLTDKFKTIGNGVPFQLSNGIAKTIYEFIPE